MPVPPELSRSERLVALVWLACGAWCAWFQWRHDLGLPLLDEVLVPLTRPSDLLASHYGHRIPLPRLILWGLYELGGPAAMRAASWSCPWIAAGVAARLARRLRGRTTAADISFPLLLAGPWHAFGAIHAYDLHFGLPALLAVGSAYALLHRRELCGVVLLGACLGCGVNGVCLAIGLAACLPWCARSAPRGAAVVVGVCAFGAALTAGASGAELPEVPVTDALYTFGALTLTVLDRVPARWPLTVAPVALFWLTAGAVTLRFRVTRTRLLPLWGALVGASSAWLAIALTRAVPAGEWAWVPGRYQTLVALPYVFALLLVARAQRRRAAALAPAVVLTLSLLAALPSALAHADEIGAWVDGLESDTRVAIQSLWTPEELATHYGERLFPYDRDVLVRSLRAVLDR